jgi:hypothetical protein
MDPRMAEHPATNPTMSRFSPTPENVRHDIIDKWPGFESPTTRSTAFSVDVDPAELVKMHRYEPAQADLAFFTTRTESDSPINGTPFLSH